jgi:hypothetical protein
MTVTGILQQTAGRKQAKTHVCSNFLEFFPGKAQPNSFGFRHPNAKAFKKYPSS